MALSGTDRGTGTHNTTSTTLAVTPASNFAAGMAVLVVAADNTGSGGIASISGCTDTKGNSWVRRQSPLYDPGAAAAGVQGVFFTTDQRGGLLTTGDTITVSFFVTTVAKAWTLMEVVSSTSTPQMRDGADGTGSATATPTITTASIASGDMVIGGLFNEYGTAQVVTGDADATNGSWSAVQTIDVGLTAAGMCVASQRKVVTAAATQTFNPTLLTSSDVILAWIQITEYPHTAYADTVLSLNPVYYYRLGEASGTKAVALAGADLTYVNTPTLGAASLIVNDANTSVTFARASSELAWDPRDQNLAGTTTGASMAAWVTFGAFLATERHFLGSWNGIAVSENHHQFYFEATSGTAGDLRWQFAEGGATRTIVSASWTPGSTIHFVTARHDYAAETIIFGIDGVEETVSSAAFGVPLAIPLNGPANGHASVGGYTSALYQLNGTLDEVAMFKTVLTAANIAQLYSIGKDKISYRNRYAQLLAH